MNELDRNAVNSAVLHPRVLLGVYCSGMNSSHADDPLSEIPTVSTDSKDGVSIVTIATEASMHLRVILNNRILFEGPVAETVGDVAEDLRD